MLAGTERIECQIRMGNETLDDDLAGLQEYFERDHPVIVPLNMLGPKLLERRYDPWQKRGLISECDHEQSIAVGAVDGYRISPRNNSGFTTAAYPRDHRVSLDPQFLKQRQDFAF